MRLIKNSVQCLLCNDTIESTHRHDFKSCKCGAIYTDGGRDYIRRGGDLEVMKDLCEYAEYEDVDEEMYTYYMECLESNNGDYHLALVETADNFDEEERSVEEAILKFKG